MSFEEFVELYKLMSGPDAEYRIAFRLADRDGNGFISKDEFQEILTNTLTEESRKFNWSSDWVNLFFGVEGKGTLSYLEFSQLLEGN